MFHSLCLIFSSVCIVATLRRKLLALNAVTQANFIITALENRTLPQNSGLGVSKLYLWRPDCKYFRFYRFYGLCCSYSTPPLECKNSLGWCINEWAWLHSNKTLFTKVACGPWMSALPVQFPLAGMFRASTRNTLLHIVTLALPFWKTHAKSLKNKISMCTSARNLGRHYISLCFC